MSVQPPAAEPEPEGPRPAVPPDPAAGEPRPPQAVQWRVPGGVILGKLVATVAFAAAALFLAGDATGLLVSAAAALAVGAYAVRDLLAPVRLAADGEGVTVVTGFASRTRLPWSRIERIRIDERTRFGLRSALLEIDADTSLHLFGPSELGQPVEDVAEVLRRFRTGR